MAYSCKLSSSLALVALLLTAIASLPSSQAQLLPAAIPHVLPKSISILGAVSCNVALPTSRPVSVNVTLSCDGGITALVPQVQTNIFGGFSFNNISGATAALVNATNCAVFVRTPVAGCIVLGPGQALRASITLVSQTATPIIGLVQTLLALVFRNVTIT